MLEALTRRLLRIPGLERLGGRFQGPGGGERVPLYQADALRARVAELEGQLAVVRQENLRLDDLARASYRQSLRQHVRVFRAEAQLRAPVRSAALQLPYKLRNLELAASHGIGVPEIYAVWPDVASLHLAELPDRFVLKADGGAGSVAVLPLERLANGSYRVVGGSDTYSQEQVLERVRSLGRKARPPYFAEELLYGVDGAPIPHDVKCYMFYGEVGHILVRRVGEHGRASTIQEKFVDEHGTDLGPVAVGRPHDESIGVPDVLPQMVQAASHLSRASGLPFCRVDLYRTPRGIVLGEVTRAPRGGDVRFVDQHDELLGHRWIGASARLNVALYSGRPVGPLFGTAAELRLYPPDDNPRSPVNFPRTVVDCSRWCF